MAQTVLSRRPAAPVRSAYGASVIRHALAAADATRRGLRDGLHSGRDAALDPVGAVTLGSIRWRLVFDRAYARGLGHIA